MTWQADVQTILNQDPSGVLGVWPKNQVHDYDDGLLYEGLHKNDLGKAKMGIYILQGHLNDPTTFPNAPDLKQCLISLVNQFFATY